jgi:hypothetical protein
MTGSRRSRYGTAVSGGAVSGARRVRLVVRKRQDATSLGLAAEEAKSEGRRHAHGIARAKGDVQPGRTARIAAARPSRGAVRNLI